MVLPRYRSGLGKEFQEVFLRKLCRVLGAGEQLVREFPSFAVEIKDLLLDRIADDQAVDGYRPFLSDLVRAVGRLVFHRWISPRVEMNRVVGGIRFSSVPTASRLIRRRLYCSVWKARIRAFR